MKKIWAPWRSHFIYDRKRKGCIFCNARDENDKRRHFVLKRTKFSFAMLNIYPYNNSHIMVVPLEHKGKLTELSAAELKDIMLLLNRMTKVIDKLLKPHGYNIGVNIGAVSGAGFPGHVHIHLVPRWKGDTNFMPVLSGTKVISESLNSLYDRLTKSR